MKAKKSINSRRGGGSSDTGITWWKCLILSSLFLLVSFLVRLNYQLMKELGGGPTPTSAETPTATDDSAAEEKLQSLRRQVSTMKEKVGTMKGEVEKMKAQTLVVDSAPPPRR